MRRVRRNWKCQAMHAAVFTREDRCAWLLIGHDTAWIAQRCTYENTCLKTQAEGITHFSRSELLTIPLMKDGKTQDIDNTLDTLTSAMMREE